MAQQGSPPRRSARLPGPRRPEPADHRSRAGRAVGPDPARQERPYRSDRAPWHEHDAFAPDNGEDLPPWAGPGVYPTAPGRRELKPPGPGQDELPEPGGPRTRRRGRAAAARLRKSRRRVYRWCGTAIAVAVVIAVVVVIVTRPKPAPNPGYITTLQPGEFKAVPNACGAVTAATLSQYLPGQARKVNSTIASSADSQCTLTVDTKPVFRVLEVTVQAYPPSVIPPGNGSATASAVYSFGQTEQGMAHPPRRSAIPKAVITPLPGLGQQAFSAVQVFRGGGVVTDKVTVVIRDRNVVIAVSLQGQDRGAGFGPVPVTALQAGALAGARETLARAITEPTA
ncbi:MAG: hypothetical protein ACLPN6_24430 [Streptosporangiaceae bacterium]|nr:hypothetical protein [Actinomycetota bacterium]